MLLSILTILHFLTDGVCGATLAEYALAEPYYEPIIYYFTMYTILAFGSQFIFGYILDKKEKLLSPCFITATILLVTGGCLYLDTFTKVLLIGLGNSIFHVTGGSLIMRATKGYSQPGIFVSGGAVGLGLGLNSIVPTFMFVVGMVIFTILLMWKCICHDKLSLLSSKMDKENRPISTTYNLIPCIILLLFCIILRSFGGGDSVEYVMLFPCVFALGKSLGGICADKIGYMNTVMLIFIGSFVSLQFTGLIPLVMLTFFCNMTMPLTLRLLCQCEPNYFGTMFGLTAGCLVPGFYWMGAIDINPIMIVAIQFIVLYLAKQLYERSRAANAV